MVVMREGAAEAGTVMSVLEGLGFRAERYTDAGTALDTIEYRPPALVVHGFELPDMDGATFHTAVGRRAGGCRVPTLAILPDPHEPAPSFVEQTGIRDYLCRPVRPETLAARLRDLLGWPAVVGATPRGAGGNGGSGDGVEGLAPPRPEIEERAMADELESDEERETTRRASAPGRLTGIATGSGLRIRPIALGEWGIRAAGDLEDRGYAARVVDFEAALERSALPPERRHPIRLDRQGGLEGIERAARALATDRGLGEALATDADADLFFVLADLSSGAGTLAATLLHRLAEAAPDVGRLVIALLPGLRSGPDERALALVALNAVLKAPESGILLVRPPERLDVQNAEVDPRASIGRLLGLVDMAMGEGGEPVLGLDAAALARALAMPGFVGWREFDIGREDVQPHAHGWHDLVKNADLPWELEGYDWPEAQAVVAVGRVPRGWLESGGRAAYDRFLQESWDEAVPCLLSGGLFAGEPPLAALLSTGMPYPLEVEALRGSVHSDREQLAEKRRAATRLVPLEADFLPGSEVVLDQGPAEASPEAVAAATEEAGPVVEESREPAVEEHQEPEVRIEEWVEEETWVEETWVEEPWPEEEPGQTGPEARREPERTPPPTPAPEPLPGREPLPEPGPGPEPEPTREPVPGREPDPLPEREPVPEPHAMAAVERLEFEAPASVPPAYDAALQLVRRVLAAGDLRAEVDLGEVRYALYDLLEVLREEPQTLLPEVFRPTVEEWFERHHVNVAVLAILTGDLLKGSLSEVIDLGTAALLHDLGMIPTRDTWDIGLRLPPHVFERAVRPHPEVGFRRLQEVTGMSGPIARMVLEEHERMDGSGYPEGLSGDAIDPGARILAACDTLEALSHPRPYRDHLSAGEALGRLQILGAHTLDGTIVDALVDELGELLRRHAREGRAG